METEVLREDVYQLKEQIRLNSEKLDRSLAELRQTISMLSLNKGNRHNSQYNFSFLQKASYESPTKCLKIELPKFYGENAIDWLYQCEHNFEINRTPEQSRVEVAVMHMEGKALQWYKILLRGRLTREPPRWKEFVDALRFQFVNDPIRELTKLKQIGSIRLNILRDAYCLAKLQEQVLIIASKQCSSPVGPNSSCVEEMKLKPKESKHSANDSKSAPLSSQQLNTTKLESSISSRDVMVDELHVVGGCTDLADKSQASKLVVNHHELKLFDEMPKKELVGEASEVNASPFQEDLTEIEKPQIFDEISRKDLMERRLNVFDETPRSEFLENDLDVLEGMPKEKNATEKYLFSGYPSILLSQVVKVEELEFSDVTSLDSISFTVMLKVVLFIGNPGDQNLGFTVGKNNLTNDDIVFMHQHNHGYLLQLFQDQPWIAWPELSLPPPERPPVLHLCP
ncbi:hypothetical protein BUALT_Bualt01G0022200 [Buddleja alternifolia]|uniref:Retrotransposon gag domain-containing protein n=1 Tax=Buddleja alternifolia TaxID=168488 RepID=A0AAV6Y7Y4_9LAMI|nr:hypothetical protein BUALT_Bualt01G0022200 [Buddleja alternifolia]